MTIIDEHRIYLVVHLDGDKEVGPVKVGYSKYPEKRLASLQTGNPRKLVILASFRAPNLELARHAEAIFHKAAHRDRLSGEWFDLTPVFALASLIKCMIAIIGNDISDTDDAAAVLQWAGSSEAIRTLARIGGDEPHD